MRKFPKLSKISDPDVEVFVNDTDLLYILEKVDGANFRWSLFDETQLLFGSRKVVFKRDGEPSPLEETNKQFRHVIKYLQENVNIETLKSIEEDYGDLVFYGESMHNHTVDYEYDGKHPDVYESDFPNYIGFDIWNQNEEAWLSHETVVEIHNKLGLETVPVIKETTVQDIQDEDLNIPQSNYRTPDEAADDEFNRLGLAEGIVIKNDAQKTRAKKVSEYMQEVNHFGEPDDDETIEELKERKRNAKKFVGTFVTDERIRKNAHKLVDEGNYEKLQMPMMKDLPKRVLKDIFVEEGWAILNNEYDIKLTEDSKEDIRQMASDKCARILKEEINSS